MPGGRPQKGWERAGFTLSPEVIQVISRKAGEWGVEKGIAVDAIVWRSLCMLSKDELKDRVKAGRRPGEAYIERHFCEEFLMTLEGLEESAEAVLDEMDEGTPLGERKKVVGMLLRGCRAQRIVPREHRMMAKQVVDRYRGGSTLFFAGVVEEEWFEEEL